MKLTLSVSYGIGVLLQILEHSRGCPMTAAKISRGCRFPPRFLYRVLHKLVDAGLLRGTSGPGGGYELAKLPERITLLDIVGGVEGAIQPSVLAPVVRAYSGAISHVNRLCQEGAERFAAALRHVSLADLARIDHARRHASRPRARRDKPYVRAPKTSAAGTAHEKPLVQIHSRRQACRASRIWPSGRVRQRARFCASGLNHVLEIFQGANLDFHAGRLGRSVHEFTGLERIGDVLLGGRAGTFFFSTFTRPGIVKTPGPRFESPFLISPASASSTAATCFFVRPVSSAMLLVTSDLLGDFFAGAAVFAIVFDPPCGLIER